MLHKKIKLNDTAYIELYIPDDIVSYKKTRKWPVIVICPGGGYMISAIKEGEAVALQFLSRGYACIVLRYSTFIKNREAYYNELEEINDSGYYPSQIIELMNTLHMINESGEEWSLDTSSVFTIGFSAGAHIVAMEALRWNDETLLKQIQFIPSGVELKPKGSILCYPMLNAEMNTSSDFQLSLFQIDMMNRCLHKSSKPSIKQVENLNASNYIHENIPELFVWHTSEDVVTNASDTTLFIKKLQEFNLSCEYHLFKKGRHGLACANKEYATSIDDVNPSINLWLPLVFNWMEEISNNA